MVAVKFVELPQSTQVPLASQVLPLKQGALVSLMSAKKSAENSAGSPCVRQVGGCCSHRLQLLAWLTGDAEAAWDNIDVACTRQVCRHGWQQWRRWWCLNHLLLWDFAAALVRALRRDLVAGQVVALYVRTARQLCG